MALKIRHRLLQHGLLAYGRLSRGMTLGVRALLLKGERIFLVRHSYVPGWYLPGGGVEVGESVHDALVREIREEAGVTLTGPAELFGIYRNPHADRRDHVVLFVCRHWEQDVALKIPNREIVAAEFFPLTALPEGTTPATAARISEVLERRDPPADW